MYIKCMQAHAALNKKKKILTHGCVLIQTKRSALFVDHGSPTAVSLQVATQISLFAGYILTAIH